MTGKRGQGARRQHGGPCNDEQRSTRLPGAPAATPAYENRLLVIPSVIRFVKPFANPLAIDLACAFFAACAALFAFCRKQRTPAANRAYIPGIEQPSTGNPMLQIQNVVKSFGKDVTAVDDVSLDLGTGVVGLIGHNGAGKTTLMQMIATLMRPTSGRILFQGVDIKARPDAIRRRLGYLPQDFGVYRT
jgi:ABC-type glutathione transport system ATPase component